MSLSSDDEDVFTHRRSSVKKIFDSDEEDNSNVSDYEKTNHTASPSKNLEDFLSDDSNPVKSPDSQPMDTKGTAVLCEQGTSRIEEALETPPVRKESITMPPKPHNIMATLSALAGSESESDSELHSASDGECPLSNQSSQKRVKSAQHPSGGIHKSVVAAQSFPGVDYSESKEEDRRSGAGDSIAVAKKGKAKPERKSKTVAKSAMLEIKADSQRRLRESSIGLPYHIPKERTLLDFLSRRKTSSIPVKAPADSLLQVWKELEKREKEAETFYKSDSEGESDPERNEFKEEAQISTQDSESCLILNKEDYVPSSTEQLSLAANDKCEVRSVDCDSQLSDTKNRDKPVSSQGNEIVPSAPNSEDFNLHRTETEGVDTCPMDEDHPATLVSEDFNLHLTETEVLDACPKNQPTTPDSKNVNMHLTESEVSDTCLENKQAVEKNVNMNLTSEQCDGRECVLKEHEINRQKNLKDQCESNQALITLEQEDTAASLHTEDIVLSIGDTETFIRNDSDDVKNITPNDQIDNNKDLIQKYGFLMTDSEDENEDISKEVSSIEITSKRHIPDTLKPVPTLRLKGTPNDIIDLDDVGHSGSKPSGVHSLKERFLKHSSTKAKPSSPQIIELSVISSEKSRSGDIIDVCHESIQVSVNAGDETPRHDQTPGAKLKLLKGELFRQMKKQKEEEWKKIEEERKMKQEDTGEKEECNGPDFEDEDEEEDDTSETESEPEINDIRELRKKKRVKNAFLDEEAEDEDADESDCADGDSDSESEDGENVEGNELSHVSAEDVHGSEDQKYCKVDNNISDNSKEAKHIDSHPTLQRMITSADLFASQISSITQGSNANDDDYELIPPAQPRVLSPEQEGDLSCPPSPINYSFSLLKAGTQEVDSETQSSQKPWSSCTANGISGLFTEVDELSTQDKMNELMGLCSGKFNDSVLGISLMPSQERRAVENDLMALCSGEFVSQPSTNDCTSSKHQTVSPSQHNTPFAEESQDFSLKWNVDEEGEDSVVSGTEKFSKGFELELMSSDEEDTVVKSEVRKKSRKLDISDDEECKSEDLPDDCESDEESLAEKSVPLQASEVFYDSDENEVTAAQFFENEAELSEEEWEGSEDEDEMGLDQMEMNEADKEDIDEDQIREDIVKSHMQKVLDEDRRDVRILQEMLLEDGELHSEGGGRERQFRWRNVDLSGMSNDVRNSDDEVEEKEDEEDDAEWRKKRHEREMFLKQQQEKQGQDKIGHVEEDDILQDSELLQLGKAVILKSRNNSMELSVTKEPVAGKPVPNSITSPDSKQPSKTFGKRGSFLSRSDGVLAKLAQMMGSAKENTSTRAKSSGNFVFAAVSPPKANAASKVPDETQVKVLKRKAVESPGNSKDKKPCLMPSERKRSGLFQHL